MFRPSPSRSARSTTGNGGPGSWSERCSPASSHPIFEGTANMARMVKCIKLGREAEGMDFPPYPGDLGKRLFENVSKEAWAQWLRQQTMLVNENRLSLADPRARKYLAEQMERHFFGGGADVASGYVPPKD